jgi:predicted porin
VPNVGNADTFSYYLEAKYKLTPQLFGALRWNQQLYDTVSNGEGGSMKWGHDLWRIDASVGYRFTPHTQLKLQYSVEHEDRSARDLGHLIATQFTVRF